MSKQLRVLVTGSRKTKRAQERYVEGKLEHHLGPFRDLGYEITIIQGECPYGGVDRVAKRWGQKNDCIDEPHPADWSAHGKSAGRIRNTDMVDSSAGICLAFPGKASVGTPDCLNKAWRAGIPTHVYPLWNIE